VTEHVRGVDNIAADTLSREQFSVAHSVLEATEEVATVVPQELLDIPGDRDSNWHGPE